MAWFDNAWDHRREVTVDNSSGAAKTNYPVKISLTSASFDFTEAQSDGADVRVTDADEITLIDHWIESWDSVGETAVIWAEVPSIPGAASKSIYLYYGNAGVVDVSDIGAAFPAGIDFSDVSVLRGSIEDDGDKTLFNEITLVELADIPTATFFREQDCIVHDPNDPNLGTNPEREYKLYFSATLPAGARIYVLFSADGETWGSPQACITGDPIRVSEDPSPVLLLDTPGQVYRDVDDKMYLYTEDGNSAGTYVYESTDGINFTTMSGNPVIPKGAPGSWEEQLAQSPCAVHDGTQFIVGYEGFSISTAQFGIASGTSPNSLTKSANNPVLSASEHAHLAGTNVVIDTMWKVGSQIKLIGHAGSGPDRVFGFKTSNLSPATWVNADFSEDGKQFDPGEAFTIGVNFANPGQVTGCPENDTLALMDVNSETPAWRLYRSANNTARFTFSPIDIINGQLVITPYLTQSIVLGLYMSADFGLPNEFRVEARAKQVAQNNDNRAGMGFGAGSIGEIAGNTRIAVGQGYSAFFFQPGSATGLRIGEYDAAHAEILDAGSNYAEADANVFKDRRFTYRSTGALAVEVGASTRTGSDTTHVAGNKKLYYFQGTTGATGDGAITTVDHLFVRPYDGADPTQTVGSQESGFDPANLAAVQIGADVDLTWDASF